MATSESTTGKPSPTLPGAYSSRDRTPAPCRQGSPRPCPPPGGFPAAVATPGSTIETDPQPTAIGISTRTARVYPAPGALPARFQPQWPPPRAQLGRPPPPSPGADHRPAPSRFAPPLPRSRFLPRRSGDHREHNWDRPPTPPRADSRPASHGFAPPLARCPPSPGAPGEPRPHAPTPGSSRGSRTSLLPPGQTRGHYIHPTETIQAVYDLGIQRGLQKGKMA